MELSEAEYIMLNYICKKVKSPNSLSLVGEYNENSTLKRELESKGYKVVEVFIANKPINGRTHFKGRVVIGTRPCDEVDGDLTAIFIRAVRYWNHYFILIPCSCLRNHKFRSKTYEIKIATFIHRYKYIESVDCVNNWFIFHNLDDKLK